VSPILYIRDLLTPCDVERFGKKLLGENEIKAVLQRLDRLTLEEARTTSTETLEVVYGLVKNVKVVMDGAHPMAWLSTLCLTTGFSSRRKTVDE
jgi:hypothetical protein